MPRLAAVVALIGLCGLGPAWASQPEGWGSGGGIGSGAFGIGARFVADGTATFVQPVPQSAGSGLWPYSQGAGRASVRQVLGIAAGGQQIATLQITAGHLRTHAESGGFDGHFVAPSADGTIETVQMTLQQYPPPVGAAPLLSIFGSDIAWQASDSEKVPQTAVVAGGASFSALTIAGSLLSGSVVTATGRVAAGDPVTVQAAGGGSVQVTLDQQVVAGLSACSSTCSFTPFGVTVAAIAIHLDQVMISGHAVSGDITVGEAQAQIAP